MGDWFQNTGDPQLPAVAGTWEGMTTAARSRHPGRVNAAMCDASVRFFSDSISLAPWQNLGSMNGEEAEVTYE